MMERRATRNPKFDGVNGTRTERESGEQSTNIIGGRTGRKPGRFSAGTENKGGAPTGRGKKSTKGFPPSAVVSPAPPERERENNVPTAIGGVKKTDGKFAVL